MIKIKAKFDSRCGDCGQSIEIGDEIGYELGEKAICIHCLGDRADVIENRKSPVKPVQKGVVARMREHKHTCHWPGCGVEVPPKLWGCKEHWFRLPESLRRWIWETYVPGQEITKTPSADYLKAAQAVQEWIKR